MARLAVLSVATLLWQVFIGFQQGCNRPMHIPQQVLAYRSTYKCHAHDVLVHRKRTAPKAWWVSHGGL